MRLLYLMMYCILREQMINIRKNPTAREDYFVVDTRRFSVARREIGEAAYFCLEGKCIPGGWVEPNSVCGIGFGRLIGRGSKWLVDVGGNY